MRRHSSRGLMALENENLETGDLELGDAPESLETDLLEVNDEAVEAETSEAETDEAVETTEALESIAIALESASQAGGLDAHGAHILDLHTQSLYKKIGLKRQSVPAMESFGGTSTRQRSTQIALEDIKDTIKKIWEKIVQSIKDAINWVKERFTKIFGAANKLEARAKALAEKAGATTGNAKEKTFESERLVKALEISGSVPSSIGTQAQEISKMATGIFGSVTNWNGEVGDSILDLLGEPSKLDSFGLPARQDGSLGLNKASADHGDAGNGMVFMISKELPGGQAIIARFPSDGSLKGAAAVDAVSRSGYNIGKFNPKAKDPSKNTVTTLAPSEAEKVAQAVETLAQEVQSYKRSLEKLAVTKEKIVKAAEKAGKDADNASDEDGNARTNGKALAKLGMAVPKLIDQPATSFSAYSLNTGKALLDYVEMSLKQYGAK